VTNCGRSTSSTFRKSRPDRFASRFGKGAVAVVLEPDVAQVFDSSKSVNRLLRPVIEAVPSRRSRGVRCKPGYQAAAADERRGGIKLIRNIHRAARACPP